MSNIRMGPWDLELSLQQQMEQIRKHECKSWRYMLTEGCRMFIASRGMEPGFPSAPVAPAAPVVGVSVAPLPVVGVSVAPVAPLPVAPLPVAPVVVLSPAEKELKRSRDRFEMHKARIVEANAKLALNPEDVQALKQLSTSQHSLPGAEADLAEAEKALAAEQALSSNPVDNETNGGDV
jgi:hypothetical protein